MKAILASVVLAGAAVFCVPSGVAAWDGPGWAPWAGAGWWWATPSLYATESIPYFAEHPPVYYSHVVPRAYGFSPYAYPPGVLTPEVRHIEPVVVCNQYAPAAADQLAAGERATRRPLRIANPFASQ